VQELWHFIVENQKTLGWLSGGLATIAIGAWTVLTFFLNRKDPAQSVTADHGVANIGDIRNSPITITNSAKPPEGSGG
jgi:hypothetical protein